MNNRAIQLVLSVFLVYCTAFSQDDAAAKQETLKIYLPREAKISQEIITLGQISVVRGPESTVAKIREIVLGRIDDSNRQITLSRAMILGRISCSGIEIPQVELSGAQEIKISLDYKVITSDKFVEVAKEFLDRSISSEKKYNFSPIKMPKDLSVPGGAGDIQFTCRLTQTEENGKIIIDVAVLSQGKQIASREVHFKTQYTSRRIIARQDISSGQLITEDNTKIENSLSDKPEPQDWKAPYGLLAKRRIAEGDEINSAMVRQVKPEIVVRRNKHVAVVISRPGLSITSVGRALEDGCAGEYIKVRMQITDDSRTIIARVNNDGTVEPVM